MSFLFNLVLVVIIWCFRLVLVIANLVIAIMVGIFMTIIFIPVLLFNLAVDRKADHDSNF
jgi:hypothetical protein